MFATNYKKSQGKRIQTSIYSIYKDNNTSQRISQKVTVSVSHCALDDLKSDNEDDIINEHITKII